MKIAIIGTRGIPNNYGGFEQFAEYLSVGLVGKGVQVTVFSPHHHPYKFNKYKKVDIVHCNDPVNFFGTFSQFIYDYNCIAYCRKKNYDIIFQLGYTSSSIWNFLIKDKTLLVTNMDGIEWNRSKYSSFVKVFLKYAERLAVKHSNYFISDSLGIKSYLLNKFNIKSQYFAYGTDFSEEFNISYLLDYSLKSNEYDIIIARMEPENNIEMILKGYLNSNKERELVVVGNIENEFGSYLVKKYNDKKIKYLGFVSGFKRLSALRYYSELYFHGHSVGGTNPSLLEAMSSRSLICSHNNIFNKSILEDSAFYFKNNKDVSNLMNSIVKKDELEKLNNNSKKVRELYSWDVIVANYYNYFKKLVNE